MVVTIFRSRLNRAHAGAYQEMAARMRTLAEGMPGFISFKTFNAEDGERVSLIEFASEETLRAGGSTRNTGRHKSLVAQRSTLNSRFKYVRSSASMVLNHQMPNNGFERDAAKSAAPLKRIADGAGRGE